MTKSSGRPRQHTTDAQKQAAYRARRATVDRAALEALGARLDRLQAAVATAARAGDEEAQQVAAASTDTMLDRLAEYFEQKARKA